MRRLLNSGIAATFILLAVLSSCKNGGGTSGEAAKLSHSMEVNKVDVVPLERKDFRMQLLANGKLAAKRSSRLAFGQSGIIKAINVRNGERVSAGQTIAELERSTFEAALETARLNLSKAELDYLDVIAGLGYSPSDTSSIDPAVLDLAKVRSGYGSAKIEYRKAEEALAGTVLKAPFSGKVADISARVYENSSSEPFCTLLDDSSFEVNFSALESEYPFLSKGQEVKVTLFNDDTRNTSGSITCINPKVDEKGLIGVTATIPGDSRMIDGMNVKVCVERSLSRQLVVPKSAVVVRDNLDVVFRFNDGKADWVYVNILNANSESYVIEANSERGASLSEGDLIITSGNLNLGDGSSVALKNQ